MKISAPTTKLLILILSLVILTICRVVPVYADQSQSFVWVADTRGDKNDDVISTTILTPIVNSILALSVKPKVVIFGGDAAYRGGYSNGTPSNLIEFKKVFTNRFTAAGIDIPSVFAIGNHELYTMHHAPKLADQALERQADFQGLFNSADLLTIKKQDVPGHAELNNLAFSFHIGNSLFIVADSFYATTNAVEPGYGINQAQQDWMKGLLENNKAAHTFVLTHVPAWSPEIPSANPDMTNTWTTITTSSANNTNASILFAGHEHIYYRTMHDGTYQVLAGTGGAPMGCETEGTACNYKPVYPDDVYALRYNYAVTSINGREITVSVFDESNSSIDMFHFFDYSGVNNTTINNTSAIAPAADLQQPTGILAGSNNIITNSAPISNVFTGIDAIHHNTITNSSSIKPSSGGNGILAYDYNTITNTAAGSITGESTGLWGIRVNTGNTVINHGTIDVTGKNSIAFLAQGDNNTFTNTGTLKASGIDSYAAKFLGTGNSLVNSGTGIISGNLLLGAGNTFRNSGTFTHTGTFVNDGIIMGNGTTTGNMSNNGTIMGNGTTIGNIVNNGTIAPGNSIGTLTITGDYTHNAGATYKVEADADGHSDKITVSGKATINGGTVSVNDPRMFLVKTNYDYTILTAGSIEGTFGNVTSNYAFLTPSLSYAPTNVSLRLSRNATNFSDVAATSNQYSVASALDRMESSAQGDMITVIDNLLNLSAQQARRAYDQMGGGTHTAFHFMSFSGINNYHGALNNHLAGGSGFTGGLGAGMAANQNGYPQDMQMAIAGGGNTMSDVTPILLAMAGNRGQVVSGTNWGLWLDGYYSQGDSRADEVIGRYKQNLYGALMGFDYGVTDNLLIGVSTGISQTDVKFEYLMDKGQVDSYKGSVYTYYDAKPWYAHGVLTYAYNKYKTDRFIAIGDITRLANADYKGNEYSGYAEVGYKLDLGGVVVIQPMVAFQATYLMQDSYTETGAGDLNLIVDSCSTSSYQSYLGMHIGKAITMGNFVWAPDVRVKWAHEFSSDDNLINARFSSSGSRSFTIVSARPNRNTAIAGVGLTGKFNKNLSMYIQYDAELNSDYINHTGTIGLRFTW